MISERLISKPKILVVQACQGDETQHAREVCSPNKLLFLNINYFKLFYFRLVIFVTMVQVLVAYLFTVIYYLAYQPCLDLHPFDIPKKVHGSYKLCVRCWVKEPKGEKIWISKHSWHFFSISMLNKPNSLKSESHWSHFF